jgi:hypothetical protein
VSLPASSFAKKFGATTTPKGGNANAKCRTGSGTIKRVSTLTRTFSLCRVNSYTEGRLARQTCADQSF